MAMSRGSPQAVYPRVCGGNSGLIAAIYAACGLSPRVRGKRRVLPARRRAIGSIPACAGETS